jgi:hypothetical protein
MKTRSQRTIVVVAVLTAAFLVPAEVRAPEQSGTTPPVTVGSRGRIQAPTVLKGRIEGLVMEIATNSLLLSKDQRIPLRIPRQSITSIEVSTGRHRRALRRARAGTGETLTFVPTSRQQPERQPLVSGHYRRAE